MKQKNEPSLKERIETAFLCMATDPEVVGLIKGDLDYNTEKRAHKHADEWCWIYGQPEYEAAKFFVGDDHDGTVEEAMDQILEWRRSAIAKGKREIIPFSFPLA